MILNLKNVSKSYIKGTVALRDFSLEVEEGEFFCIVGPSGCGKSTVLKLIAGLEEPTTGQLERPQNISMVFQSGALFPWLDVLENVSFSLKMRGEKKAVYDQVARKYIDMVKLTSFAKKLPRELSGGQRQRVGIARSLALSPQVLLLDEPFSALDPITTDELHQDLLDIWKMEKLTIVMVSHSLEEAVLLSDRICVMNQGQIRGIVENSLERPRREDDPKFIAEVVKLKKLMKSC